MERLTPQLSRIVIRFALGTRFVEKVRTSSSDTCPFECRILSQNVNVLGGDDKLEKLVETMIQRNVAGFCVQETWKLGNFITTIRGHTIIHHGMKKKNSKGRISAAVAIILNPVFTKAWSRAGKLPSITSNKPLNFSGIMIGVTISFPCSSNRPKDA